MRSLLSSRPTELILHSTGGNRFKQLLQGLPSSLKMHCSNSINGVSDRHHVTLDDLLFAFVSDIPYTPFASSVV